MKPGQLARAQKLYINMADQIDYYWVEMKGREPLTVMFATAMLTTTVLRHLKQTHGEGYPMNSWPIPSAWSRICSTPTRSTPMPNDKGENAMIKIIHTADWHPKSHGTIGGKLMVDPETGLGWTLTDFRLSLAWLLALIREEKPDALLLAGDVFDTPKPDMDELRVVLQFIKAVHDEGVAIAAISGNHDSYQSGTGTPATWPLTVAETFCVSRPDTILWDVRGEKLRIDCLPFPSKGRLLSMDQVPIGTPEEINTEVNRRLGDVMTAFQMAHTEGEYRILLAHGSVDGAKINEQPRSLSHDILLPIAQASGYHYIALGHIHQQQQMTENAWYSGSLMRNGFGEEKEKKGVNMVSIERDKYTVTFKENPHAREYRTLALDELEGFEGNLATCYRVKGTVTEEEWLSAGPTIVGCQDKLPFFQVAVEIDKGERQRDKAMTNEMTPDQALERCLDKDQVVDPLLSSIRNLHSRIMEEAR